MNHGWYEAELHSCHVKRDGLFYDVHMNSMSSERTYYLWHYGGLLSLKAAVNMQITYLTFRDWSNIRHIDYTCDDLANI